MHKDNQDNAYRQWLASELLEKSGLANRLMTYDPDPGLPGMTPEQRTIGQRVADAARERLRNYIIDHFATCFDTEELKGMLELLDTRFGRKLFFSLNNAAFMAELARQNYLRETLTPEIQADLERIANGEEPLHAAPPKREPFQPKVLNGGKPIGTTRTVSHSRRPALEILR
tara:strand:+ start:84 stop:599 length:516 start_codon:yes stop_codon:yes gene_type:complete